ncbi:MAG: histidine phosphatase family protein [bacterium]|nr:histidine phosphatase family protein [bacterium]
METKSEKIFTLEKEKFGQNVEIHAIFVRHGEKDASGKLTEEGKKQAAEFGKSLESKDAIKGYSSSIERVVETVEQIIKNSPNDKKLKTRIRTELSIPPVSQEFLKEFREKEKEGHGKAIKWFLDFGIKKPDSGTDSPHEIAESFAYVLMKYFKMADKLYSGSDIDLVNGTHQGFPESLLMYVLKRKTDNKEVVGFDDVDEIGGALKFTEGMEFIVKTEEQGDKKLTVNFRGQEYDIDMEKLKELAESYVCRKKIKKT